MIAEERRSNVEYFCEQLRVAYEEAGGIEGDELNEVLAVGGECRRIRLTPDLCKFVQKECTSPNVSSPLPEPLLLTSSRRNVARCSGTARSGMESA